MLDEQAELQYVEKMQGALSKRIWNSGCHSVSGLCPGGTLIQVLWTLVTDVLPCCSGTSKIMDGTPCHIRGPRRIIGIVATFPSGGISSSGEQPP